MHEKGGEEMTCRIGGQVQMFTLAPWPQGPPWPFLSATSLVCGVALGGGREGTGSGVPVLARSQHKAGHGLLNFSRWQRIKQAVAALTVPRQGELAGLEPPTGWGGCLALPLALLLQPGPSLYGMRNAHDQ